MTDPTKKFEIVGQETIYQGFFTLERYRVKHTLYEGGWSKELNRELFRRGSCVAVLLYDPGADRIVLIEQFRVGAILNAERAWLLEIVAGAIEPGETAEQVAYREAMEEAGCQIQHLKLISEFYTTPGGASERISLFCGKIDSTNVGGVKGLKEEDEDILVRTVRFGSAYEMMERGEIDSAIPMVAIQWLALNKQALRREWGVVEQEARS